MHNPLYVTSLQETFPHSKEVSMLLRFEVGNHRSICEPVGLSMIAMDKDRAAARQVVGIDQQVLTIAGIYGANGSGKSNILDALSWLSHAVRVSLRSWEGAIPVDPFNFSPGPPQPTSLGVELVLDDVRYCYELQVERSGVAFEALYSYPQRRRRALFEREGEDVTFRRGTRFIGGGRELITPTTLVLSAASRLTDEINLVARWLQNVGFVGVLPRALIPAEARLFRPGRRWMHDWDDFLLGVFDESPSRDRDADDAATVAAHQQRDRALAMLKFADLGVQGVEVADHPLGTGPRERRLRLLHDTSGDPHPLELGDESDGTLVWLALMPELLSVLEEGGLIVVDELDASLHPMISGKLVKIFQDPSTNPRGAQIIFSTHDTSLLGYLNRDEVWRTSKRPDGSTELTPLSDYRGTSVRPSTNLERGYLEGRFGGVPVVDEFLVREAMAGVHRD